MIDRRTPIASFFRVLQSLWRILAGRPAIAKSLKDNPLLQTVLNRRSVRHFSERELPEDVFTAILEAGRLAPSTVNLQTWSFAIFTRESWMATFDRRMPFNAARGVLVMGDVHRNRAVFPDFPTSPLVEYTIAVMNASLAAMNMNIAAEALGVSSVMLSETGRSGLLDADYLKSKLQLPGGVFPIMTIVFGYPARAYPPMPPKLPLEELCFTGSYRESDRRALIDWRDQMAAGYQASNPRSSLETQLQVYRSKIGVAETQLHAMIFGENDLP